MSCVIDASDDDRAVTPSGPGDAVNTLLTAGGDPSVLVGSKARLSLSSSDSTLHSTWWLSVSSTAGADAGKDLRHLSWPLRHAPRPPCWSCSWRGPFSPAPTSLPALAASREGVCCCSPHHGLSRPCGSRTEAACLRLDLLFASARATQACHGDLVSDEL
jgi:hypothetical protein